MRSRLEDLSQRWNSLPDAVSKRFVISLLFIAKLLAEYVYVKQLENISTSQNAFVLHFLQYMFASSLLFISLFFRIGVLESVLSEHQKLDDMLLESSLWITQFLRKLQEAAEIPTSKHDAAVTLNEVFFFSNTLEIFAHQANCTHV